MASVGTFIDVCVGCCWVFSVVVAAKSSVVARRRAKSVLCCWQMEFDNATYTNTTRINEWRLKTHAIEFLIDVLFIQQTVERDHARAHGLVRGHVDVHAHGRVIATTLRHGQRFAPQWSDWWDCCWLWRTARRRRRRPSQWYRWWGWTLPADRCCLLRFSLCLKRNQVRRNRQTDPFLRRNKIIIFFHNLIFNFPIVNNKS